jgi:polyhydroxyalkanoate synthesis regulator phasin
LFAATLILSAAPLLQSRAKDRGDYGAGLIMNLELPLNEVSLVVEEIVENGIIRGTKEYNKDEYVTGAVAATNSAVFPPWTGGGKVFYKVRAHAIDPRNFKDGGDVGTLAVRYVVQSQGDKNTVLRIDAVFVEDFRHTVHPSNGSVESNEFRDIQDHLDGIELMKKQTAEAAKLNREQDRKHHAEFSSSRQAASENMTGYLGNHAGAPPQGAPKVAPAETLEEHVQELRRQVQRVVKSPGAPLKSAPFQTASTLKHLPSGTEILVLIDTPYWYGVETHDGQHGWLARDQLELP